MSRTAYSVLLILIAAFVTLALRAFPFVVFGGARTMPEKVKKVVDRMPPAIMAVLVIYCIKADILGLREAITNLDGSNICSVIATAISLLVVVIVHLWRRQTLLSIGAGTVIYMVLIRVMEVA